MFSRKRPVVQLTSLLDLLFIMIFISLTSPMESSSSSEPVTEPPEPIAELSPDQLKERLDKAKTKNELLAAISETPPESPRTKALIGEYRKLFVANLYYFRGSYRYTETIIYSADNESGLYEYRVNLQGAGILATNGDPLVEKDVELIKVCDKVTLTREKIYQDCRRIFDRHLIIDCNRSDDKHYHCRSKLVRKLSNGSLKTNRWEYKMELVKIYDPTLI